MKSPIIIITALIFSFFSQAQNNNYSNLWKKVEAFEIDGLPKSALQEVLKIEKIAERDNNETQLIKTLLFKSKYHLILEEDAKLKVITDFKKAIKSVKSPHKNILENSLANLYWQYFQANRYKFYNRTKTEKKVDENDFRTWDLQTLFTEIKTYFDASLKNGLLLQESDIKEFEALLTNGEDSKLYQPTLFDILSYNALNFYKTTENSITKPTESFSIHNAEYLNPSKEFVALSLKTKDKLSTQFEALATYQELINFHLKKENHLALAYANINRLNFVKQYAQLDNEESMLLETYKKEVSRISDKNALALYNFEIASIYNNQASRYVPIQSVEFQFKNKEAVQLCEQTIKNAPNSLGAKKCERLKFNIINPSLRIVSEANLIPNQKQKLLVNYKNLDQLNFSAYKISKKNYDAFLKIYKKDDQKKFINKLKTEKTWETNLKNENDYQNHSVETIIPELKNGLYIIFANADNDFWAITTLQVTHLALSETEDNTHKYLQITDRSNGRPIKNVSIELSYSYRNEKTRTENLRTDVNGFVSIDKSLHHRSQYETKVMTSNEVAYFGRNYINHYHKNSNKEKTHFQSFLFTDRAIYRPGQTVYFKTIALKTILNKSEVLPNQSFTATLYNTNDEKVSSLKLKTNDFGSASGEFILPNNGLNGEFYIETEYRNNDLDTSFEFDVEEYKRPKFETTFNPITETHKVNDSITVKGKAVAFSASTISNAKVVYKVKRNVSFSKYNPYIRPYYNYSEQEITFGETTTNDKGEFEITYKAIPDDNANKENLPVFNYEVIADVTDINGETRSETTTVKVGYHALKASVSINPDINKQEKNQTISIYTSNLNDEFVNTTGTLKIYKLKAPKYVLRQRPWQAPDYKSLNKEAFKKLFHFEAYDNENQEQNWEKGDLIYTSTFNTEKSQSVDLPNLKKWDSGLYKIEVEAKNTSGETTKAEVNTRLFSDKDKTLADNKLFSIQTDKSDYETGDIAKITFGSSAKDISVTILTEKDRKLTDIKTYKLNNEKTTISLPITKTDLGGFAVHYSYVFKNTFQSGTLNINVPYPTKQLEIETLTFRDKLQPGTSETWQFKIKGKDNEKVSAELLASMYDASLDEFASHNWYYNPYKPNTYRSYNTPKSSRGFGTQNFRIHQNNTYRYENFSLKLRQLNSFGLNFNQGDYWFDSEFAVIEESESLASPKTTESLQRKASSIQVNNFRDGDNESYNYYRGNTFSKNDINDDGTTKIVTTNQIIYHNLPNGKIIARNLPGKITNKSERIDFSNIKIRKNLQETAFFFPKLTTDKDGIISFSFTTPEALTKWNLNLLAHNRKGEFAQQKLQAVTQKELMVIPNTPRYLRQGDIINISTKIANLINKQLIGQAKLILTNAITGEDISNQLIIEPEVFQKTSQKYNPITTFSVDANGNTQVSWRLKVPNNLQAVQYQVLASANNFSDGEQNILPVLTNRMLVTETLSMHVKTGETKTFTLNKLKTNNSKTLKNHMLTLEVTSNPAWYAVQALPYLMEYPYDCNEQIFSRFYANSLASHFANSNPKIQEVFKQWKNSDALLSNLEKNQELKSILIQETPWLRDAQSEAEQKKRIALLFDLNKMTNELNRAKNQLKANQLPNGAWSWFGNYKENRYITQHIISGFGHLKQLNVNSNIDEEMITSALSYLDAEFLKTYNRIEKKNTSTNQLSPIQLNYLYLRSFYSNVKKSKDVENAISFYNDQIKKYWLKQSLYQKGMMALIMHRNNNTATASKILKSLKENSITNDELGIYWKENTNSYYWYQAPIETQALLIEAFSEIENDTATIDNLKIWLLKNKQTNRWKTTKASTNAIYAILLQGTDWLSVNESVSVLIGQQPISNEKLQNVKTEAGTGYYKTSWNSEEITKDLAEVTLTKKEKGIAYGALYWQYFEDLDKITPAKTPLQLNKKLFLKKNTSTGEVISEIDSETNVKVGDLIRVRIELKTDRTMEYIHLKDMRASGLEPINVKSSYKYQDGLGYYETTKDASTNFFFDVLPKGIYVFEYDLRVNNSGDMSNGITSIQSMYAPEFTSHSEGIRIKINQ